MPKVRQVPTPPSSSGVFRRVRRGRGHLVGAARCPHCGGDLSSFSPLAESILDVVTIVVRRFLADRTRSSSTDVAEILEIAPEAASERLFAACAFPRPLLRRVRQSSEYGGFLYLYAPTEDAAYYLRSTSLANELRERLPTLAIRD